MVPQDGEANEDDESEVQTGQVTSGHEPVTSNPDSDSVMER